jgi:cysteine desulfurase
MERVYLDNNATTRPSASVLEAIRAALDVYGNPSSLHAEGRAAARLLAESRATVASFLGARPSEVTFTSGGTEADRLAVLGALAAAGPKRHAVSSAIEHSAIRELLRTRTDVETTWIRPRADGRVDPDEFAAAFRDDTAVACLMAANSETGVLQPVAETAAACRARGVAFVVDAVQAVGKAAFDFRALGADLAAVSAHKFHGPKGAGALLVRDGARWTPPFPSSHEAKRRAGTEAIPAIAGFAAAAREASSQTDADRARVAELRDRLERTLSGTLDGVSVNGTAPRTANTSNLHFDGVAGDRLLAMLDRAGVDASSGSACSASTPEPSHVLLAMGLSRQDALSAIRFSLSRLTTGAEIDRAVAAVIESVETLRTSSRR